MRAIHACPEKWQSLSEDVSIIVRAISFQDFQPMWSWSTNVTDGQTDDMRSQDRAMHNSASRGKNWVTVIAILTALHRRSGIWGHGPLRPSPFFAVAVLEKKYLGPGPSSSGRQQRLSEITIEPIYYFFAGRGWARFLGLPRPKPKTATASSPLGLKS